MSNLHIFSAPFMFVGGRIGTMLIRRFLWKFWSWGRKTMTVTTALPWSI